VRYRGLMLTMVMSFLAVNGASAQSAAIERTWEIDVHGGGMWASNGADGKAALPPPGPSVSNPVGLGMPSRVVSSWFFGDGATQLNQALVSFRSSVRLTPLDPVLQSPFVERRAGGSFGFRIGRTLTPRFGAEFDFDYGLGTLALTDGSASGVEAARASFISGWNGLLSPLARNTQTVTALSTVSGGQRRQAVTTGTLLINFNRIAALTPYAALGAGVATNLGTETSATLVGDYQFGLVVPGVVGPLPLPSFHETDSVTIHSSIENALVWVIGGGFKYAVSARWGLRFDLRDYTGRNSVTTLLAARPASIPLTPNGALTLGTTPSLRFSGFSGSPSTLSGAPISGFETFRGTGATHRVNVTAGLFWRF
jgi:hypothetical protein